MANNCRILTDEQKSSVNSIIGKYGEKLNNVEIENAYSIILNYIDNTKGTEEAGKHIVTLDELEKFFIITRDLKLNYDNNKELRLVGKSNNDKVVFKETKDKAMNYHYLVLENNIDSNTFVFQDLRDTLVSKNIISPILYNDNRTGYMTKRGVVLDSNLNIINSEEPILVYNNQSVSNQIKDRQIVYTPIGKTQQTYTIRKSEDGQYQIINKKGKEVFKKDNKDRRRIFANLSVQEGRAVVVEYKDKKYVVNNKDVVISVTTGDLMKWGEENGDRKAIIELAKDKFNSMKSNPIQSTSQNISQPIISPTIVDGTPMIFNMDFEYGNEKAEGVTADTTLEAIKRGERTATTRYISQGNIDRWSKAKVGDILEFKDKKGNRILVRVTKPMTKLSKETTAEEWSAKEGWNTNRFYNRVKSKIDKGEAYQIEFEYIPTKINTSLITKIISGGQTGVDTIGLQVAKELGIETGGTAPKGFLREKGIDNEDIASYGLEEITDEEQADYTKRTSKTDPYTGRTELNVRNSDGTVYFATDDDSAGLIATERSAKEWKKPFIKNPTVKQLIEWIKANNIRVLNVAGNRGSLLPKNNNVAKILREALQGSRIESNTQFNQLGTLDNSENFNNVQESEKILSSERTILSNEELKYWNEQGVGKMPRILVGSERTDPAFHVKEILNILEGKKKVNEWGIVNKKRTIVNQLSGKDFAGLYLITKHDGLPMLELLKTKIPKLIHFSITSLGGTKWEPGVMKYNDLLDRIKDYIKQGLDPNSVTIRIDPIVPGVTKKEDIENIVKRASEMGIKRIRFSIMDAYDNTQVAMKKLGYNFDDYYTKDSSGNYSFHANDSYINEICDFMLSLKDKYNITLGTCAEKIARKGISKEGCLSVGAINNMLGTSIEEKGTENNNQRKLCTCYGGKIDALQYNKNCASHCVYCYAKHENDNVLEYYNEDGILKDNEYTRTRGILFDNNTNNNTVIEDDPNVSDEDISNTNVNTSIIQTQIDQLFPPRILGYRVSNIARWFCDEVDKAYKKSISNLKEQVNSESASESLKAIDTLNNIDYGYIFKNIISPKTIFDNIYNQLKKDSLMDEDVYIKNIEKAYESLKDTFDNETAWKNRVASIAKDKQKQFSDIVNNKGVFEELCRRAIPLIELYTGYTINPDINTFKKIDFYEDIDEKNTEFDEESYNKENYMDMARQVSAYNKLSFKIKQFLSRIAKVDSDGYIEEDDWLNQVSLNADYAFSCLVDLLSDMVDSSDVMSRLKEFVKYPSNSWAEPIIEKLEKDPSFITDFYVCFNNTFTNYWIQKEKTEGYKEFTMFLHLNRPMGVGYWINTWRNDFSNGTVYDKDSIWNKDKYANVEKVDIYEDDSYTVKLKSDKYLTDINSLTESIDEKRVDLKFGKYADDPYEQLVHFYEYLEDPEKGGKEVIPKLSKLLNIVGINLPESTILAMCTSDKENIDLLIGNIRYIIEYANEKLIHSRKTYKGENVFPVIDPFNKFKQQYLNIAEMIGTIPEGAVEQTFKAGDNKYYSYHNHNYISSLIAKINDTNDERRSNFIREEFMKSSWFFNKKTNEFTNPFFEYLFNIESLENIKVTNRHNRALDYKVLLLANDKAYEDWNSVESMKVLYNEYISEQSRSTIRTTYEDAYFPIPVISDVKSAEFMHLPLLDVFASMDINKEKNNLFSNRIIKDYELGGLNFFEAVVMQEYNRIMLVRERYNKLCRQKANNEKITVFQIANWDTTNGKNGGAEFKFLPRLNKLVFDGNKTFIEKIDELKKAGNNDALRYFIRGTIYDVLNKDFCDSFAIWNKEGGFLVSDGQYCINIKEASHGDRIGSYEYYKKDDRESVINQLKAIKNYLNNVNIDSRSNVWKYSYFTDTNDVIKTIDTLLEDKKMKNGSDYYEEFNNLQKIDRFLYNLHKFHGVQYIKEGNISINTKNGIENFLVEEMRKYYWNHAYSQAAIMQLLVTDLAFFKDMEDFQKRFKQVYSTVTKLDTKAKFNGDKAGREIERTMKLADNTVISSVINEIVSIIITMHKNGTISDYDAAYILSKYGYSNHSVNNTKYVKFGKVMFKSEKVNVADAQAYRSLDSYRSIMIMSKKWTDEMEKSYNNLVNGTWSLNDFTILAQTLKPFMYATVNKVVGYEKTNVPIIDSTTGEQLTDKEGNPLYDTIEDRSKPIYARVGIQHKNSEFTLLPIYGAIAGVLSNSPKMKAINRFMKDNDIDLIQFESAVKVGKQGVVDLNSVDRYREDNNLNDEQYEDKIYQFLEDVSKDGGQLNPDVVDEIPFDRYGISTATPEHFIKREDGGGKSIVGTQIRKLIMADMPDDAVFNIHGKQYNKEEILRLYDELNVENLLNSFKDVNDIFTNPERLSEKLRDMSIGNSKYGVNLSEGFTIDENGEFAVPLCDPIGDNKIQELCTSIFKNIISKQKIKGGSLIQVSNYGYSDDLKIVFKNKDGEILDYDVYKKRHRGATKKEYDKFAKQALDNGELSIAYFECYMPIPDMEMLAPLIDPVTGYIDINKKEGDSYIFPEELRKCIGYRIPTEAKYSMAPLYIKGFLPIQSGGAIMLPSEITTIAGSDFDKF